MLWCVSRAEPLGLERLDDSHLNSQQQQHFPEFVHGMSIIGENGDWEEQFSLAYEVSFECKCSKWDHFKLQISFTLKSPVLKNSTLDSPALRHPHRGQGLN